ncbi:hypothetical protein IVA79_00250 [Bradyrhizobium sp. 138]|uniref:hypothetical protein n=1 Tax=Bradyrhizobium sp. 138 TaxID=2782615 RepID=UPI001FF8DE8D|nr:hypothetical protein [Bradyrhizobium sp. 138]MCK1732412.1 hypothetical protein [Bradyrhizobium sp. 138]
MLAELHQDLLTSHSRASSIREQALFHLLLGKLMAARWQQGRHDIEVLKSEVDRGGYDIVLEANGILRHVQLKSTFSGSSVRHVTVSTRLLEKPSGCVVWLEVDQRTLAVERYFWFGGQPGARLPDLGSKVSRHTRGDSNGQKLERPMHRDLGKSCFEEVDSADELLLRLFG